MVRNGVRNGQLEVDYVEYRMFSAECLGKPDGVGLPANAGKDLERSEELLGKLLGGSRRLDVLGIDVDGVPGLVLGCWESVPICLDLVAGLSLRDVPAELRMEFLEVYGELSGSHGSEIALGVNCKARVVTLVSKER